MGSFIHFKKRRGRETCRFTPAAEKLFNLIAGDIGRPTRHSKPNMVCPNLEEIIHRVIDNVAQVEQEINDTDGRWYALRVRPYCVHGERGGVNHPGNTDQLLKLFNSRR